MNEETVNSKFATQVIRDGVTLGAVLALVMSYTLNKAIGWAVFHSFMSWGYVIYRMLGGGK